MSDKRQKNQLQRVLAFAVEGRSEAPKARREGTESGCVHPRIYKERGAEAPLFHETIESKRELQELPYWRI
jgi:hypothetical protein